MLLQGAFSGPLIAMAAPMMAEVFGIMRLPEVIGYSFFFMGFAAMLAPTFAGAVRDLTGDFRMGFVVCGLFCIVGSLLMLIARKLHLADMAKAKAEMSRKLHLADMAEA